MTLLKAFEQRIDNLKLGVVSGLVQNGRVVLGLKAAVNQQCRVAPIVDQQLARLVVGKVERLREKKGKRS